MASLSSCLDGSKEICCRVRLEQPDGELKLAFETGEAGSDDALEQRHCTDSSHGEERYLTTQSPLCRFG